MEGLKVHCKGIILNDFSTDLLKGLSNETFGLPIDLHVGIHHSAPQKKEGRFLVGIQSEHIWTATGSPGWMKLDIDEIQARAEICDAVLDLSKRNIPLYENVKDLDKDCITFGPYVFPNYMPELNNGRERSAVFMGVIRNRPDRRVRIAKFAEMYNVLTLEGVFGQKLDKILQEHAFTLNVHSAQVIVTEVPRLLKAFLNGSILLSEVLDVPFMLDRHYIGISSPNDHKSREAILTNIHDDFSDFRFDDYLTSAYKRWERGN